VKILYSFSSPQGDVAVDDATLARPFIVRLFQNHPFMTLGDYFLAIRDLILREKGQPLTALLGRLWNRTTPIAQVAAIAIRYEKYGTLYHISSVEIVAGTEHIRLAVSTAVTDESKEALDREFDLLKDLARKTRLPYLPRVYCKQIVSIGKEGRSETVLVTLSEWFDQYHEWHFSRDGEDRERMTIWDTEGGYWFASEEQSYEIIKQASAILTFYYDTKTHRRIFPWHHGGGDFVVKASSGRIDVRLVTARGYEAVRLPERDLKSDPVRALVFFFLETTVKMRLDKYEGVGESTWACASVVQAATHGFFQALRTRESKGDLFPVDVDRLLMELKDLTLEELNFLRHAVTDAYRSTDASDYSVVLCHVDGHAGDVYDALQGELPTKTP